MLLIFLHIFGLLLNAPGFIEHMQKQEVAFEALLEYETNTNSPRIPQCWPKLCHAHCQPVTAAGNRTMLSYLGWNFANLLTLEPHSLVDS